MANLRKKQESTKEINEKRKKPLNDEKGALTNHGAKKENFNQPSRKKY